MSAMFTIDNLSAAQAEYLVETVAPVAKATTEGPDQSMYRLVLSEAGLRHLEALPEDSDGHVDEQQRCWIGGDVAGVVEGHENW